MYSKFARSSSKIRYGFAFVNMSVGFALLSILSDLGSVRNPVGVIECHDHGSKTV